MGLLSDALKHLLASDETDRRDGLAGLMGRVFGVEPEIVRHPSIPDDPTLLVVHYPKRAGRTHAVTLTLGPALPHGGEHLALTLAALADKHLPSTPGRSRSSLSS